MKQEVVIFLPGFPGEAFARTPGEIRVVDLVKKITGQKKKSFVPVVYPGIKTKEPFSFEGTLESAIKEIEEIGSKEITLVGQSWGGLLAFLISKQFSLNKILLITPYLIHPSEEEIKEILSFYAEELPTIIQKIKIDELSSEILRLFSQLSNYENRSHQEIKALVCKEDETISIEKIKDYLLQKKISYEICSSDHNFSNTKNDLELWLEENV
jgi:surfactin synthase thioesterase subunit